ncbi:MAG: GGDEF domain-containing protein [Gammaproteobacteria bacterium]|nr:GGDEF domain-containing protein [Gammaproteobacteria bacterium]MBU3998844.1 GGDEF domain-containing protein [Gammaproteobacteria bacterium]MBU4019077.1 GGDEF domain-containing protein [Gammaproteobacteria bacterium]MBU4078796.1 GGDEF domain-containing protein [Gammaproteobacteria bacterium]MBU4172350.1 GGDEF domain-containing protein [Gammaproteobacteria bacterium]
MRSPILTSALLGANFGTPAEQQHLLALEQTAREALAEKRPWLRFAPQLEWQFELDSTAERVARFRVLGLIALIILNLFNITDRTMLPDIADQALMIRLGILTPIMAVTLAALHLPFLAPRREWLISCLIAAASGSLVYFFSQSQHPNALHYHTGVILVIMFGNIVIRQRFRFALSTSVAVLALFVAGISQLQQMSQEIKLNSDMVLFAAVVISLVANYQMEYDSRQAYLHTLLQRIEALKLKRSHDELDRQANSDPLTGLANRRYFDSHLLIEWGRAQREQQAIALIYLDVDNFKAYNDHYGHQAGDECLIRVAKEIQQCVQRNGDVCARYGGEEFVILLPQTSLLSAQAMAEKVREAVQAAGLSQAYSDVSQVVTISCGVACTVPAVGDTSSRLIRQADQALYAAKSSGRNRVSSQGADTSHLTV